LAGWAKANVLHCVGFELGVAALLILLKRWLLSIIFSSFIVCRVVF